MRPLLKTAPVHLLTIHPVQALLMQTTGEYCHLCECRLPDHSFVMDKRNGQSFEGYSTPDLWPHLIQLCDACYHAQQQAGQQPATAILYPDEQLTFSVHPDKSPFVYEKRTVLQAVLDADGKPLDEPQSTEMVFVKGTNESAQATIRHFQLNTAYYDEATNSFNIRLSGPSAGIDIRVRQRTEVWNIVNDYISRYKKLLEVDPKLSGIMLQHGRLLAAGSGYWSVWATLLWQATGDQNILANVLLPTSAYSGRYAVLATAVPITDQVYPGTHPDVFE